MESTYEEEDLFFKPSSRPLKGDQGKKKDTSDAADVKTELASEGSGGATGENQAEQAEKEPIIEVLKLVDDLDKCLEDVRKEQALAKEHFQYGQPRGDYETGEEERGSDRIGQSHSSENGGTEGGLLEGSGRRLGRRGINWGPFLRRSERPARRPPRSSRD